MRFGDQIRGSRPRSYHATEIRVQRKPMQLSTLRQINGAWWWPTSRQEHGSNEAGRDGCWSFRRHDSVQLRRQIVHLSCPLMNLLGGTVAENWCRIIVGAIKESSFRRYNP